MKDKRRNSEKRKEKSRDAARCRRSRETDIFTELANSLPLPASVISQLDKASVMRMTISFFKICRVLDQHNWADIERSHSKGGKKQCVDQLFPKALDGFVFILSSEGDIVFINDTVAKYLGIQQIDLMGQSIFDFAHPRDEDEIRDALVDRPQSERAPVTGERVFFVRMKCTLTAKGRNVNLKSASYKVIKCTGRLVMEKKGGEGAKECKRIMGPYLLCIGEPIPHPSNIEIPMDHRTFLSKHDMDMTFTYCDERVKALLNYNPEELEGKSLYDYHHAMDSGIVEKAYKDLLAKGKGQTMTGQYRFLARGGGMAWVVTQATTIYNGGNHKAQWVVCVHYVISQIEHKEQVLSEVQLPNTKCLPASFQLSTESIFARKTKDMDQGFFIPPDLRHTITMVDSEPEDLTYLAPMAGDACLPLSAPTFTFSKACSQDEERTLSSPPALLSMGGLKKEPGQGRRSKTTSPAPSPVSTASSSRMSSPRDYCEASPQVMMNMDQFFQSMNCSSDAELETIDFNTRAPYIPMDENEDHCLSVPTSDSLLTMQNEVDPRIYGKTEHVFKAKTEDIFDEPPNPPRLSVREMICGSTAVASIEQPPDTMFQQLKRPLDMNSLEKGPPALKMQRLGQRKPALSVPHDLGSSESKNSVLLNLLMKGEDPNGYKVIGPDMLVNKRANSFKEIRPFLHLTNRDCEVNAPIQLDGLLQGADLLKALEIDPR